jgi:hypothetical protein
MVAREAAQEVEMRELQPGSSLSYRICRAVRKMLESFGVGGWTSSWRA